MNYDKSNNDSDDDYFRFIEWLEAEIASDLKQAKGNVPAIQAAIRRYLEIGYGAHITSGELVDFFCVSTPSILHKAGYSDEETDLAVTLYDKINPEFFSRYYPNSK